MQQQQDVLLLLPPQLPLPPPLPLPPRLRGSTSPSEISRMRLQAVFSVLQPDEQPDAIAAALIRCDPDPEWRERILRGMTLVAMFDGSPSPEALALLEQTATDFQVVPLQLYFDMTAAI